MLQTLEKIDHQIFYLINRDGQHIFLEWLMPVMSNEKNFFIPIALFWIYLVCKKSIRHRTVAVSVFVLLGLTEFMSSDVLKPIFDRPRPYHSVSEVHLYDRMGKTWSTTPVLKEKVYGLSHSMPSSHATNTFGAMFFLSYYFRKWIPLFYGIAILVGYSRVYLGVHFPSDVVAGALVGTLCGLAMVWCNNRVIRFFEQKFRRE